MAQPLLKWFQTAQLPPRLQLVSRPFGELARWINTNLPDNDESREAVRKLLEAKDCAVRAAVDAGLASVTPPPGLPEDL